MPVSVSLRSSQVFHNRFTVPFSDLLNSPVRVFWETFKFLLSVKSRCRNVKAIYFFWSGQNTLSDFLIFLWPIKDIASVRISRRQRITLTCMFSCGIVCVPCFVRVKSELMQASVCIGGSARIYYTHLYLYSYDILWWGATVFVVMSIETGIGIVCGCFPGCKPLMSRMFPRVFGTTSSGSNGLPRNERVQKETVSSGMSGNLERVGSSFEMYSWGTSGQDMILPSKRSEFPQNASSCRDLRTGPLIPPPSARCNPKKEIYWPPIPCRQYGEDYGNVI